MAPAGGLTLTPSAAAAFALGPCMVGMMLAYLLTGCMITQTYFYFITYKSDALCTKIFVIFLLFGVAVNCVIEMWWVYDLVINGFGDIYGIMRGDWRLAADPAMIGIMSTSVQLFFAWRVKILTNNWWLVTFIVLTSITSCCGALTVAVAIRALPLFVDFHKFNVPAIVWLASSAVCDTAITIILTTHLRRNRTGFTNTDSVLKKITRLVIQNSLITTIWAIINLFLYLFVPDGLFLAFNFCLGELYANTLMVSLNAREGYAQNIASVEVKPHVAVSNYRMEMGHARQHTADLPEDDDMPQHGVFVTVESHRVIDSIDEKNAAADNGWEALSPGVKMTGSDASSDSQSRC